MGIIQRRNLLQIYRMLILIVDIVDIVNILEVDLDLIPQELHSQVGALLSLFSF